MLRHIIRAECQQQQQYKQHPRVPFLLLRSALFAIHLILHSALSHFLLSQHPYLHTETHSHTHTLSLRETLAPHCEIYIHSAHAGKSAKCNRCTALFPLDEKRRARDAAREFVFGLQPRGLTNDDYMRGGGGGGGQ